MEWVKAFTELIKAIAHLWPFALIWLGWHFRVELRYLIGRILKAKLLGAEIELEAIRNLEVVKAAAGDDKKGHSWLQIVEKASDELASVDKVELMELALTDTRQAVLRSFYLLSKALVEKAFPNSLSTSRPIDDPPLNAAIRALKNNGTVGSRMLTQIGALLNVHKAVRHGAYVPSEGEAADFVFYSTSLREELGDKALRTDDNKKPNKGY